jgi:hypothetical protein
VNFKLSTLTFVCRVVMTRLMSSAITEIAAELTATQSPSSKFGITVSRQLLARSFKA